MKEVEKDGSNIETLEYQLLKRYEIKPPSYTTVRRWVHYLGFKRGAMQKTFYVDGREHLEQKKHRSTFTTEYLTRLEPCSHRWIQIEKTKFESIQESLSEGDKIL